ncbi:MAG: 50S ribosomal protein L24 [Candidatus Desulfaltia sp.]|nr:50S ribosomal protein L24 [Candidatus Desulfaltia sp.]
MIRNKCLIKKGDKVKIIVGKDNGKIGNILKVIRKDKRVLVEKANLIKRHVKPSAQNRQGGIVEGEAPISWSNVVLMCGKCMSPVRIKMKSLEDGKKIRVCMKCNEIIDS